MSRAFYAYLVLPVVVVLLCMACYLAGSNRSNAELREARDTIKALYEANGLPTATPGPLKAY